jgi:hypothetical protein
VRWLKLSLVLTVGLAVTAAADSARIIKVLPHYLDLKGRTSLSPSLFDRDAYQADLRTTPTNRSAIRFDVQWKASGYDRLTLRLDLKGGKGRDPSNVTLERNVSGRFFSQWTPLPLTGTNYETLGELVSWRATLLDGTNVVAEQKSFLW